MRQPVPFGKYLLLDRISVGGMAEVFKAKSYGVEGFEKIIAIKRILPTMGEDRDFIKMFIDEAKIAGQLAHANICQIFELGRIDGSHFIAMEYIWGKDLLQIQNRLRKIKQPMPVNMACFTIAKVLEGLDYAHRKRDPLGRPLEIVHRDCSPQNVLVSYEGEVKIIDFGIAKATSRNSRTMAGVLKGKFGYMSPEQVRGLPLDRRSDIFALGTMLYECLTSDRLFQGETDFSTLEKVRNVDIQPPRAINPHIPEAVENVIMRALSRDVDDRYQWCSEMLADIQGYLMSQEVVFTAKSLSSWLKEVFATEIERERQLLEQYKRVGRDGLINGMPAAEAPVDIVGTLGEAPPIEGDPTVLGEPDFDDIERATSSSPEVGPAPGSPAARGAEENDFVEEAPTEIFGEIDEKPLPAPAPPPRAPTSSHPTTRPPRPPPSRPPTRPSDRPMSVPMAAGPSGAMPAVRHPSSGGMPVVGPGMQQQVPSDFVFAQASPPPPAGLAPPGYGGYGTPNSPQQAMVPPQMSGLAPPGATQGRTLLGVEPPPGLPNYGQGYPPRATSPPYAYPPYNTPQQGMPGYPMPPGQPQYLPPSGAMIAVPAVQDSIVPVEGQRKKSTLLRDVMIGVAIAALVLVGFLAVKFFVLDTGTPAASLGEIRIGLPTGVNAEMYVDGKRSSIVSDGNKIAMSPGAHKVKLLVPNGQPPCEKELKLQAGQSVPFDCTTLGAPAGSGSGGSASGSGSGSGSDTKPEAVAEAKQPDVKDAKDTKDTKDAKEPAKDTKPEVKAPDAKAVKPPDTKPEPKTVKPPETKVKPIEPKPVDKTKPKVEEPKLDSKAVKPPDTPKPPDKMPSEEPKTGDAGPKGFLQVYSKPTAKILVDGVDTGMSTPISGKQLQLSPGKHKITFVIGDDRFTYSTTIKSGQTETMTKDLQ